MAAIWLCRVFHTYDVTEKKNWIFIPLLTNNSVELAFKSMQCRITKSALIQSELNRHANKFESNLYICSILNQNSKMYFQIEK